MLPGGNDVSFGLLNETCGSRPSRLPAFLFARPPGITSPHSRATEICPETPRELLRFMLQLGSPRTTSRGLRQYQRKATAPPWMTLQLDPTFVGFHHVFDDREAEARAFALAGEPVVDAVEL